MLATSFVSGATPTQAQAVVLMRSPYIQSLTSTSVIIAWRTNIRTDSLIRYDFTPWADPAQYRFAVSNTTPITKHALTMTGLFPDTTYYYCIEVSGAALSSGESFHTARTTSNPKVVFGISADTNQAKFAEIISEASADLYLNAGDMSYQRRMDGFFDAFEGMLKSVPAFPSPGNHEWYEGSAEWYQGDFYLPHNNPEGSELYYSFDYGNAHFISLSVAFPEDLDWKEGSSQYNWLVNDLENTRQFWKFAYFHFPPYSSAEKYFNYDVYLDVRENLSPLFEKYGVDIVFNGNNDLYERTKPMRNSYPDSKGVTYIVCGADGSLHESGRQSWTAVAAPGHAATTIVEIDGARLNLKTVSTDGSLIDTMSIDRSQDLRATMEVYPIVLTERAEDRWLTVWVEPSSGYDPANISINSVRLNNELEPVASAENLADRDGNGLKEREFSFDYQRVWKMLDAGEGSVPLRLTGGINGIGFEASSSVYIAPRGVTPKIMIASVGSGGEALETADGQVRLSFPEKAVIDKGRVVIRRDSPGDTLSLPSSFKATSTRFSLILSGDLSPQAKVMLSVSYPQADIATGAKPESLTLLHYEADNSEWTAIPGTVDTKTRTVTVTTDNIYGEWLLAGKETGKASGLPAWGWIAISAAYILLVIFAVRRYSHK
ncbi:purple acid phosphatase family protein [Chloroflexota bacterium]